MLTKFIFQFVHPVYRNEDHPNFRKVIIYTYGLLLSALAICIYSFYFLSKYPLDSKNFSNILGLIVVLISIFLLRFYADFRISLGFIIIGSFPLVVAGVYLTGGIYSSNLIWFIILANSAFFNVGKRIGVVYSIACFLVYFVFYYLSFDPEYNNIFTEFIFSHHSLDNFFNICFSSAFSFLLVYGFANAVDEVNNQIKKVNDEKVAILNLKIKEKTNEISALRSNLAKDFHDEMGNKLAGINVLSQMLEKKLKPIADEEIIKVLETIQQRSNELFIGTKDFIWSIDFKSDYVVELVSYIQSFGEDFFSKLNISFVMQNEVHPETNYRLNVTSGRQLVVIFKEAMTNIAKHAKATEVVCHITVRGNTLEMLLIDNGLGFDPNLVSKNGLLNMQDRAKAIGSELSIVSAQNKGTHILVRAPLDVG